MLSQIKRKLAGAEVNALLNETDVEIVVSTLVSNPQLIAPFGKLANSAQIFGLFGKNALFEDPDLWLSLIPYVVEDGHYRRCKNKPAAESIYAVLYPLFRKSKNSSLALEIAADITHPGLTTDEVREILDHCIDVHQLTGQASYSRWRWRPILNCIDDRSWLRELMANQHEDLGQAALRRFGDLLASQPWEPLYDDAVAHPELFIQVKPRHTDVGLWRALWNSGLEEAQHWAVDRLINVFGYQFDKTVEHRAAAVDWLQELSISDPELIQTQLQKRVDGWGSFPATGASWLYEADLPDLKPLLPALLAHHGDDRLNPESIDLLNQILRSQSAAIEQIPREKLPSVVAALREPNLSRYAEQLLSVVASSTSQTLRAACVEAFGHCEPSTLEKVGWLSSKTKHARLTCLEILTAHTDPDALEVLKSFAQTRGLDQNQRDRILDHLESKDIDVTDLDEIRGSALDFAEEAAAKTQRISKVVEQIFSPTLASSLPSLTQDGVRWLLQQMAVNKEPYLSRSTRKVLEACPTAERKGFADALVAQWVVLHGDPKTAWSLQALELGADDSQVGLLVDAIGAWHKKRKPRAVRATQALGQIGSLYALSQVKAIAETKRNPEVLVRTAQEVLAEAARAKGLGLAALYDQLVPDFGLNNEQGLALEVGPYAYRVKLLGDLTLRVIGPTGRATKTLPKAKPEEDSTLRQSAEVRFKQLRKDLKLLAKQQTQRIPALLMGGRHWPVPAWRKLFVDHPIFRALAQSLIWSRRDGNDQILDSFRLTEDLSLLNAQEQEIQLDPDNQITLWHPIDQSQELAEIWRTHLSDYEIQTIVDQVDLPVHRFDSQWLAQEQVKVFDQQHRDQETTRTILAPFRGYVVSMAKLKQLMNRWGYRTGPSEDGGYIYEHTLRLDDVQLEVQLLHSKMPAWFEENEQIAIRSLNIQSTNPEEKNAHHLEDNSIDTSKLPAAMLSMLYEQMTQLAESGSGYDDQWKKL